MNKDKYIGLRVSADSYNDIKDFCETYGMTTSNFLRLVLDGELDRYGKFKGLTKDEVTEYINQTNRLMEAFGKVEWEVNKIGVNINSLAKKRSLSEDEKEELMGYLKRIEALTKNSMEGIWQLLV